MTAILRLLSFVLVVTLWAAAVENSSPKPEVLVRLSENRGGVMASEEVCTLVYANGQYRSETVSRRRGDTDLLRVAEGGLSEPALTELKEILNNSQFRQLTSPNAPRRLADPDVNALSVTVEREGVLQELNYPSKASRKGSEQILKPLLQWWQPVRKNPGKLVDTAQRTRCVW